MRLQSVWGQCQGSKTLGRSVARVRAYFCLRACLPFSRPLCVLGLGLCNLTS